MDQINLQFTRDEIIGLHRTLSSTGLEHVPMGYASNVIAAFKKIRDRYFAILNAEKTYD